MRTPPSLPLLARSPEVRSPKRLRNMRSRLHPRLRILPSPKHGGEKGRRDHTPNLGPHCRAASLRLYSRWLIRYVSAPLSFCVLTKEPNRLRLPLRQRLRPNPHLPRSHTRPRPNNRIHHPCNRAGNRQLAVLALGGAQHPRWICDFRPFGNMVAGVGEVGDVVSEGTLDGG